MNLLLLSLFDVFYTGTPIEWKCCRRRRKPKAVCIEELTRGLAGTRQKKDDVYSNASLYTVAEGRGFFFFPFSNGWREFLLWVCVGEGGGAHPLPAGTFPS